jgi:hypothetical protein
VPTSPLPGTATAPTGNIAEAQYFDVVNFRVGYTLSYKALPSAEFFDNDEHTKHDTDFATVILTDEG